MYTRQELEAIDRRYFEVIIADEYDVTLMSRNTRHIWHLRNVELPDGEVTVILHKHQVSDPYHAHGRSRTMKQAMVNMYMIDTNSRQTGMVRHG